MLKKKSYISSVLLIAVTLTAYQNCGKVEITPQVSKLSFSNPSINGYFCQTRLTEPSPEWNLRKFMIVNMTVAYDLNGKLISNNQIISMQELSGGQPLSTNLTALNSDQDFLPNFLENYFGTDSTRDDMGWDYTGESTVAENLIQRGLNPRVLSNLQNQDVVSYSYDKLNAHVAVQGTQEQNQQCPDGGQMWRFDFSKYISVPVLESKANIPEIAFEHSKDENIFLFLVVSENSKGEFKYSYKIVKILHGVQAPNLHITPEMFKEI